MPRRLFNFKPNGDNFFSPATVFIIVDDLRESTPGNVSIKIHELEKNSRHRARNREENFVYERISIFLISEARRPFTPLLYYAIGVSTNDRDERVSIMH